MTSMNQCLSFEIDQKPIDNIFNGGHPVERQPSPLKMHVAIVQSLLAYGKLRSVVLLPQLHNLVDESRELVDVSVRVVSCDPTAVEPDHSASTQVVGEELIGGLDGEARCRG